MADNTYPGKDDLAYMERIEAENADLRAALAEAQRHVAYLDVLLCLSPQERERLLANRNEAFGALVSRLGQASSEKAAAEARLSVLAEYVEEERHGASLPSDPVDAVREISEGRKGQIERLTHRIAVLEGERDDAREAFRHCFDDRTKIFAALFLVQKFVAYIEAEGWDDTSAYAVASKVLELIAPALSGEGGGK